MTPSETPPVTHPRTDGASLCHKHFVMGEDWGLGQIFCFQRVTIIAISEARVEELTTKMKLFYRVILQYTSLSDAAAQSQWEASPRTISSIPSVE
jgi:glucose uptake protein GlcU